MPRRGHPSRAKSRAERRSLHSLIDKMLSMRLLAASRCRRAGTGYACRCAGPRSRGRRRSRFGLAAHPRAADSGQDRGDNVVAEGKQGADGAGGGWRDMVAAGPAGFIHGLFAAELAQVISRLPDGIAVVAGDLRTRAACSATVNPPGAGARASAAARAARIRGLFRSIPAIRLAPAWAGSGSSSSTPSGKKPISAQSRAAANRSAIPASRSMISAKLSRPRRQRSSLALCTVASKRRTCSPLV